MKNKIRIILLVVGGLAGGHLVDRNFKSKLPVFTVILPIAAGAMFWRISSETNEPNEES